MVMMMKHEEAWSSSAQIGTSLKLKLKLKLKPSLKTSEDAPQGTKKIEFRSSPKVHGGTSSAVGDQFQRQADAPASETPIKNFDEFDQLPPLPLLQLMFNDSGDEEWLFEKKRNQQTGKSSSKRFKANKDEPMPGCSSRTSWPPKAHWLPQAGIYASPFTVPFS